MKDYNDKNLTIKEQKQAFDECIDKNLNPLPKKDFDPNDFDPFYKGSIEYKLGKRVRKKPLKELPTFGLYPKEIRVGQMIGEYEAKQDIYLTFAHRTNELQKEMDELISRVEKLENKKEN